MQTFITLSDSARNAVDTLTTLAASAEALASYALHCAPDDPCTVTIARLASDLGERVFDTAARLENAVEENLATAQRNSRILRKAGRVLRKISKHVARYSHQQ